MVDNDLVGLLGIYAMRDIGRYMKTATRKMICPLSSRQVKYLKRGADERPYKMCGRFSMHTISLYIFQFVCF